MKKYSTETKTVSRVDKETGDVFLIETSKRFAVDIGRRENFTQIYFDMLKGFYNIRGDLNIKLLVKLCEFAEYGTGEVYLTTWHRNEIRRVLGVTQSQISTGLNMLKGLGLIRGEKGRYVIDEGAFWKGSIEDRRKVLQSRGVEFGIQFRVVGEGDVGGGDDSDTVV